MAEHSNTYAVQPFGPRVLSLSELAALNRRQRAQRRAQEAGSNAGQVADKYKLIRALSEARAAYGLSDRAITVLDALITFHQSRALDGREPIIVFPSNRELAIRCRGMSPATLRRHIAALVGASLIARRDSPNGKRFRRRGEGGEPGEAFGFDLAPLALEAGAIEEAAEAAQRERVEHDRLRAEVTLRRRDIAKTLEAALEQHDDALWYGFAERLRALSAPVTRRSDTAELEDRRMALATLGHEVERAYLAALDDADLDARAASDEQEMSASESRNERHHQNSNTQYSLTSRGEKKGNAAARSCSTGSRERRGPQLGEILAVCPTIAEFEPGGVPDWSALDRVADIARSMMGISPSAWQDARAAMGPQTAAAVVAAMLERQNSVRSPGGYLRALTARAEAGKFDVRRMLRALEKGDSQVVGT